MNHCITSCGFCAYYINGQCMYADTCNGSQTWDPNIEKFVPIKIENIEIIKENQMTKKLDSMVTVPKSVEETKTKEKIFFDKANVYAYSLETKTLITSGGHTDTCVTTYYKVIWYRKGLTDMEQEISKDEYEFLLKELYKVTGEDTPLIYAT